MFGFSTYGNFDVHEISVYELNPVSILVIAGDFSPIMRCYKIYNNSNLKFYVTKPCESQALTLAHI